MRVLIVEDEPSTHRGGVHLAGRTSSTLPWRRSESWSIPSRCSRFGSIARGEAGAAGDIDLAVIAPNGWDRRVEMATAEQRNHARAFLKKSEEYLASAEDNLAAERYTPAGDDAIHAGISAKDAIVTALTGVTSMGKDLTSAAWMSRALTSSAHVTPSTCASASAGAD
jgi:Nucleotidyltransferase domain